MRWERISTYLLFSISHEIDFNSNFFRTEIEIEDKKINKGKNWMKIDE